MKNFCSMIRMIVDGSLYFFRVVVDVSSQRTLCVQQHDTSTIPQPSRGGIGTDNNTERRKLKQTDIRTLLQDCDQNESVCTSLEFTSISSNVGRIVSFHRSNDEADTIQEGSPAVFFCARTSEIVSMLDAVLCESRPKRRRLFGTPTGQTETRRISSSGFLRRFRPCVFLREIG